MLNGKSPFEAQGKCPAWPTPNAGDGKWRDTPNTIVDRASRGKQISLHGAVLLSNMEFTTPTAHTAKEGAYPAEFTRNTPSLSAQAGGALNADWVEWLMGWPIGWSSLEPLEDLGTWFPEDWWAKEPNIPRVKKKSKDRRKRLKAIGNGQVPISMAVAWLLLSPAFIEEGGE